MSCPGAWEPPFNPGSGFKYGLGMGRVTWEKEKESIPCGFSLFRCDSGMLNTRTPGKAQKGEKRHTFLIQLLN